MMRVLYAFILIFNFTSLAFAGDELDNIIEEIIPKTQLSNKQLKALRQELKIQKIFIQGVKEIEIMGGNFTNLPKATNTLQELLIKGIGAKSESLPSALRKEVTETVKKSINQRSFRSILTKTKEFAFSKLTAQKVMLSSTARRVGMDVGLVYLLSLQVDLTFPTIMIAMGRVEFAPLLVTPVSSMATASYVGIKSAVKFRHLMKKLGGFTNVKNFFNLQNQVKKFFKTKIFPQYDLLNIRHGQTNLVLTVERKTLFNKFLSKLGLNKNLNYDNLANLLRNEGHLVSYLDKLENINRPNDVKMLRLLNKIELIQDPQMMETIKGKFGKYINEMKDIPKFSEGRAWALKASTVDNIDDFLKYMTRIPDDIPPKIFGRLFSKVIIPNASKNIGPFFDRNIFKVFRNLQNNWDNELRRVSMESTEVYMPDQYRKKLTGFIFESFAPVNSCGALFQNIGSSSRAPLLF